MNSSSHKDYTDQEILKRFYADHNNEWLGSLLERYTLLLYGVCMKYLKNPEEARDAVQQVFLKVITELHKYEVSYFSSWLYMVAKNHCLMLLRTVRHQVTVEEITETGTDTETSDPFVTEALLDALKDALQHLKPEQRNCVRSFYLEKKSYQMIASESGLSMLQVKSAIQNGKRNLRLLLEKNIDKHEGL